MPKSPAYYTMQVKVYDPVNIYSAWKDVRPTHDSPYVYYDVSKAHEMLNMCYPEQVYGTERRVQPHYD